MMAIEPRAGRFEAHSPGEVLHNLAAFEPNWRWTVARVPAEECLFKYSREDLPSASIASGENSISVQGLARRSRAVISVFFVLRGEINIADRRTPGTLRISDNHVASTRESAGNQLSIESSSSWLALRIPEFLLRQRFEELTSGPYVQGFCLPPTDFNQCTLYQTLRGAESDLRSASAEMRPLLAMAYQQLTLAKLFTMLPHNLANAFDRGIPPDAPRQLLTAEAFMRANVSNPITLEDVASAAGCSPRALQRMFRLYRRESPMGVLCNYRLATAHSAIKNGLTASIAELAMSLQFSNPGRFSFLYRNAYGLTPSSTLRFVRDESYTATLEARQAPT